MTKTLTCLALVTSCLVVSACSSEEKPKSSGDESAQLAQRAKPQPEVEALKPSLAALTATAPAQPPSIVDGPAPQKQPPVAQMEAIEISHQDEPADVEQKPDFDRPLSAAEVKVERFVLATHVEQREPTGETDVFDTETKKIFAFVQLNNEGAPYSFEVHFEPLEGDKSRYGVKLQVPTSSRYRTWAWTQIKRAPGEYRAVLRTPAGEEIASRPFTIEASDVR